MSELSQVREALEDYDLALKEPYHYTATELKEITDRRAELEARLQLLKQKEGGANE